MLKPQCLGALCSKKRSSADTSAFSQTSASRRLLSRITAYPALGLSSGKLMAGAVTVKCLFGRAGRRRLKREGDGATPIASMRILFGFFRSDRVRRPYAHISFRAISRQDGWSDDPCSPNYNHFIRRPEPTRYERLERSDRLYDIVLVLDYNAAPRIRGFGSAIFCHLSEPDRPTAGCIAISEADMRRLLPRLSRRTRLIVAQ